MKIYNIVKFSVYANGNGEINNLLSYKDRKQAENYINNIIEETDEVIDYEENEFIIYEEYGETIYIELVESELK